MFYKKLIKAKSSKKVLQLITLFVHFIYLFIYLFIYFVELKVPFLLFPFQREYSFSRMTFKSESFWG